MNHSQRVRLTLREQARHRVSVATRWAAVGASALAAAFAVVLTHHNAAATPASQGGAAQNAPQLQPPAQTPTGSGGNYSSPGYGTSGGS